MPAQILAHLRYRSQSFVYRADSKKYKVNKTNGIIIGSGVNIRKWYAASQERPKNAEAENASLQLPDILRTIK